MRDVKVTLGLPKESPPHCRSAVTARPPRPPRLIHPIHQALILAYAFDDRKRAAFSTSGKMNLARLLTFGYAASHY
jgi:hypothetical protein